MNNSKSDFTQGSILGKLIPFMMPILGALILQAAYGAVDLLVVGRFGTTSGLSAVARGIPIFNALLQCIFILKSLFVIVNILFLFTSINNASITLTACANTVAIAAPAASILRPATSKRSPTIFITQATATNISGDLLSPSPLKIADKRLYLLQLPVL